MNEGLKYMVINRNHGTDTPISMFRELLESITEVQQVDVALKRYYRGNIMLFEVDNDNDNETIYCNYQHVWREICKKHNLSSNELEKILNDEFSLYSHNVKVFTDSDS